MSIVDSRVVEMLFNNKQFESGVRESMGTVDKLKEKLDFSGLQKGFGDLSNALSRIDLSPLSGAIDAAGAKFSWLQEIAIGACRQIGAEVANTVTNYAKELSVQQISAGWEKYADKTTSVQTILAATGDSMEYVNEQLDKLNWFTDETSYNFVDMVNNIGKFTSNGIKLDTSVTAMQGIANWAAISGQNAGAASRAMYNLAQAIGTGSVKLIDWKSIENANMATQEFKQKVLEAAAAQGTLKKQADGTYKTLKGTAVSVQNFNSALSEGWFDKKVLMTTLDAYGSVTNKIFELSEASDLTATDILQLVEAEKNGGNVAEILRRNYKKSASEATQYASAIKDLASAENEFGIKTFKAAQEAKTFADAIDATKDAVSTGWMKTFELIFGDYEHAKVLWTDFANNLWEIFAAGGEARNALLGDWSQSGWDRLKAELDAAGVSMAEFEEAIYESADWDNFNLTKIVREYGSVTDAAIAGALGIDVVKKALDKVSKATPKATKTVSEAVLSYEELDKLGKEIRSGSLGGWSSEGQLVELLNRGFTEEQAKVIMKYAEASHAVSRSLTEEEAAEYLKELNGEVEKSVELTEAELEARRELSEYDLDDFFSEEGPQIVADTINNIFTGLIDIINLVKDSWKEFFGEVTARRLKDLTTRFRDFTANFSLYDTLDDGTEVLNERGEKIKSALDLVLGAFKNVVGIVQNVGRIFKQFVSTLKPVREAFGRLGQSILLLFTSVTKKANNFLSRIDLTEKFQKISNFIASAIDWVTGKVDKLRTKFEEYDFSAKLETVKTKIVAIKEAIKNMLGLTEDSGEETEETTGKFEKLGKVLDAIKDFFAPVTTFFSNIWGDMQGLFDFSQVTNIADFVKAVVEGLIATLGALWDGLMSGIENLGITFGDAIKMFLGWKIGNRILSAVLKDGKKGVGGLIDTIGELIDQVKEGGIMGLLTGGEKKSGGGFAQFASGLLKVGAGLLMIAAALILIAAINVEDLGKAFGFLIGTFVSAAGILMGLAAAFKKLKINGLQLFAISASLMMLGAALIFLAGAIALFTLVSRMSGIGKGLQTMALSLGIVAVALGLLANMASGGKLLAAATAILITSVALIALAGALALFTLVADMDNTTTALITLAATLGIVVLALFALAAAGPVVIVGAAALLIASVAIIGLAVAIGILAAVMPFLEKGLTALGSGILGLATGICESIALVISTIATGIAEIAQGIADAIVALGLGISETLSALGTGLADLGTGVGTAISEVGAGIGTAAEEILGGVGAGIEELGNGIGGALTGISTGIVSLGLGVGAAITWVGAGISNALSMIGVGIAQAGLGIGAAFTFIGAGIGAALEAALGGLAEGITLIGEGISSALTAIGTGISTAGTGIGEAFTAIGTSIGEVMHAALDGLGEGISGIGTGIGEAIAAIGTGISDAGTGVSEAFTAIGTGIGEAMHSALDGLGEGIAGVGAGISGAIDLIGTSISTSNETIGTSLESLGTSIGTGFENAGSGITTAIEGVSGSIDTFGTTLSGKITEVSDSLSAGITDISESITKLAGSISSIGSSLTDIGTGTSNMAAGVKEIGLLDLAAIVSNLNDFRTTLVNYGKKAADITTALGVFDSLRDSLTGFGELNGNLGAVGEVLSGIGDIFNFLSKNVNGKGNLKNAENIASSIKTMISTIVTAISEYAPDFKFQAEYLIDQFLAGFEERSANAIQSVRALVNGMNAALRDCVTSFYNIGKYAAIGFNNGMVSMQGTIMANAAKIGSAAASALRRSLKIKSPSRVFAEIGEYTVMGLSKGIEDSSHEVVDSVVILGDALVNAMQAAMAYAQEQDYGISPSITPVLDMNSMYGQADAFNSILTGFNMQGAIANADIDGATINNSIQSRDIVAEIRNLNERMAIMDDNIQNLQIVLDTGILVGGMSSRMDAQFGVMAMRKGRGN